MASLQALPLRSGRRSSTPTGKRSPRTPTATAGTSCSSAKADGDWRASRLRAAQPAVGMGQHRRRALHAAARTRAATQLYGASRRPAPRRAPPPRLPRTPLAPTDPGREHAGALSVSAAERTGHPTARPSGKTVVRRRTPGGEPARAQRARPRHASTRASAPSGATAAAGGHDRPLRLLAGHTRPMSGEEERQLVAALAELLADWLAAHPERRPSGLRSTPECDLVDRDGPRAQEQP